MLEMAIKVKEEEGVLPNNNLPVGHLPNTDLINKHVKLISLIRPYLILIVN